MSLRVIITIITMFALAGPVLADETGGRLVAVSGKVWTQAPGDPELRARAGKTLANGTRIRTGNNGTAEVIFEDGSSIIVRNNTTMLISGIKRYQEKKTSILIYFGRVWNKVSTAIGKQVSYEVNTPVVVCGVRGTEFETAVGEDGSVLVRVDKGKVAVAGGGKSETVKRNQKVEAEPKSGLGKTSESDKKRDWVKWHKEKRENLRKNGKNLVDNFKKRITKQKKKLKELRGRQKEVGKKLDKALKKARSGDEDAADEVRKYKAELTALADKIANLGDVAVCQFGLVDHFANLATDPRFKMINGRYVKAKAKSMRRIKTKFDEMIKKGTDISAGKKVPKPNPKVTVSTIKYSGPDPQVTVSAIKYSGPEPKVTVSKIVYEGKTLERSRSGLKPTAKRNLKRSTISQKPDNIRLTPLSSGNQEFYINSMIPLKVTLEAKTVPVLIFQFQQYNGRMWQKIGQPRLTKPKLTKGAGRSTLTTFIKITKPGKYRWRCSADKGKSWSIWSKPLEVIQKSIMKKPGRVIKKEPVKKSITKPTLEKKRITP